MVSTSIRPQGCPDEASGNTDAPARIDEQNAQPRAGCHSSLDRFQWRLIRARTLRRIDHVQRLEYGVVEDRRGLRRGDRLGDQGREPPPEVRPPVVPGLIDAGVGQHGVPIDVQRHLIAPRRFIESCTSKRDVFDESIRCHRGEIRLGHVLDQPDQIGPLLTRHRCHRRLQMGSILT